MNSKSINNPTANFLSLTSNSRIATSEKIFLFLAKAICRKVPKLSKIFFYYFENKNLVINSDLKFTNYSVDLELYDFISFFMFSRGEYEGHLIRYLKNNFEKIEVFLDIGANVGSLALPASTLSKKVFAFEPGTHARNVLLHNMEKNKIDNIFVSNLAISDISGQELKLYITDRSFNSTLSEANDQEKYEDVTTVTIDQFVQSNNIETVSVIKIDVEGWEPKVIDGSIKTITKYKPLFIIEFHIESVKNRLEDYRKILSIFKKNGYKPSRIKNSGKLENFDFEKWQLNPRKKIKLDIVFELEK